VKAPFVWQQWEKPSIDLTDGNVGIGIQNPVEKFEVNGEARFYGNIGVQTAPNSRTIQCGSTQGALLGIGTTEYIQDWSSSTLAAAAHWVPAGDGFYSLGTSSLRWNQVWAMDGTINTSDAREKSNIRDLNYGLKDIMKLRAVKFNWKNKEHDGDKLGVVAQEIQKVLPEVVRDYDYVIDEATGKKTKVPAEKLGVMYADIIPVLIKGMQEQQQQIEKQQQQIDELKQLVSKVTGSQASVISRDTENSGALKQNTPNPVNSTTLIAYDLPSNIKNAQLNITGEKGNTIKQIQLNGKGAGSVSVDCNSLIGGTYYYSLVADGKVIDTKKMIVVK
jgi:hypothetical protein